MTVDTHYQTMGKSMRLKKRIWGHSEVGTRPLRYYKKLAKLNCGQQISIQGLQTNIGRSSEINHN
jgi:hypothetical protein